MHFASRQTTIMRHDEPNDRRSNAYDGLGDYGDGGAGRYADESQAWYSGDGGRGQERYYDRGLGRYGDRGRHGGDADGHRYQEARRFDDADLDAGWGERDGGSRSLSREDWGAMHVEEGYGRSDEGSRARGEQRSPGGFRGRGPKGYVRPDERIREEVCELLSDADVDASEITVKVEDGEVTLEGTVDSRRAKHEAEDVAHRARGVKDCHNRLRVRPAA
jgi:hypothetical protein